MRKTFVILIQAFFPRFYSVIKNRYYKKRSFKKTIHYLTRIKKTDDYNLINKSSKIIRCVPNPLKGKHDLFSPPCLGIIERSFETFVANLENAYIQGINGNVLTHQNKLLFDVSMEFDMRFQKHSFFTKKEISKPIFVKGISSLLSSYHGYNNYFHWMLDTLPRYGLLKEAGYNIENFDNIFVGTSNLPFQVETLKLLGIPAGKTVPLQTGAIYQIEKLVLPSLPGLSGNMPKWSIDFLRNAFLKNNLDDSNRKFPSKIYISRADATYRKVINEQNLIIELKKHGFTILKPGELDFAEQIQYFNNAEIIVSPHGAALTNLAFCKKGTLVIEFFSPHYINQCYWTLASHVGILYNYIICSDITNADNNTKQNIYIELDDIELMIKAIQRQE